jgi:hypothetical protein
MTMCANQGLHKYTRWIEVVDHRAKEILFRESAALYGSRPLLLPRVVAENFDRQNRLSKAQKYEVTLLRRQQQGDRGTDHRLFSLKLITLTLYSGASEIQRNIIARGLRL